MKRYFKPIFFREHGRFTQVDGLRALAILWTFAFHVVLLFAEFIPQAEIEILFGRAELQWLLHGHFGVDVFFIISGFLIGDLLIREVEKTGGLRLGRFFIRRVLRLGPVYYLIIALVFLMGYFTADSKLNIGQAWANLIYVNNFIPDLEQFMPWTWSLAVEEQFYLLCPLLILVLYRKKMNPFYALLVLIGVGFALNIGLAMASGEPYYFIIHPALTPGDTTEFSRYYDLLYDKLYTRYVALVLGVMLAYGVRKPALMKRIAPTGVAVAMGVVAVAMMYAVLVRIDYGAWEMPLSALFIATYRYWFAIGVALLLLLTFSSSGIGRRLSRFLSLKFWYPLAQVSYSAYLIQPLVIFVAIRGWYHGQAVTLTDVALIGAITALITFGIAVLLAAFIEKPLMALRPK